MEDFLVHVEGNTVSRIGHYSGFSSSQDIDIGNSVLIPGFINAHTHLELTGFREKIRWNGSFLNWIEDIITLKLSATKEDYISSVSEGLSEGIKGGCTFFADISSSFLSLEPISESGARGIVLYEALGFSSGNAGTVMQKIKKKLDEHNKNNNEKIKEGLSPHAPYSVSEDIFRQCNAISKKNDLPVQIHLGETNMESEFLINGTGPFFSLLSFLGQIPNEWKPPHTRPVQYMGKLGLLRPLVSFVHLNDYSPSELESLALAGSSVVICPCSNNNWFGRDKSPINGAVSAGVNIALGTDSCASNTGINMFNELRMLRKLSPAISAEDAIKTATINGAVCFGMEKNLGAIAPGYLADMISIPVNDNIKLKDICEYVLMIATEVNFSMVDGSVLLSAL